MSSIAANKRLIKSCLTVSIAFCSGAIAEPVREPKVLVEPILGLRYEPGKVRFEPLPRDEFAKCGELVGDDEKWASHFWIFALAQDAGRTHYVVGGYYSRRYPVKGEPTVELDEPGIAFSVEGNECEVFGQARELFRLRDDTPAPLLRRLAEDAAARLSRGFGGAERLQAEVKSQKLDQDQLPQDLREAFKAYLPTGGTTRR